MLPGPIAYRALRKESQLQRRVFYTDEIKEADV
jgi:hypothetical protein